MPFADRPAYGSPYPEGMAVGGIRRIGDATGGAVTETFLADGGFLYRLEMLLMLRGDTIVDIGNYLTSHQWAASRSGLGIIALNYNWVATQTLASSFSTYSPQPADLAMMRRVPIGRTAPEALQTILQMTIVTNTNTITYDFQVLLSYWRTEALYRPGFLQSFWEAPFVPAF